MTRCFEYIGGSSCKFWQVSVAGCEVTVRFGRIGTAGQTQTKPFPDDEAARRHAESLIRSKTKKGYVETAVRY